MKLNKKGLTKGILSLVLIVAMATLAFSVSGQRIIGTEVISLRTCVDDTLSCPATFQDHAPPLVFNNNNVRICDSQLGNQDDRVCCNRADTNSDGIAKLCFYRFDN